MAERPCGLNRFALDALLADFVHWYNELRPHQGLGGLTPLEAWQGIDPFHAPNEPKTVELIEGRGGLLVGFRIRR
jgi:putative transposase